MKNLQLSLKKEWFEMTKSGIKTEDYREITPRYCNRFLTYLGENKSIDWWKRSFLEIDDLPYYEPIELKENIRLFCELKQFTQNTMTLGYPKSTDSDRILILEHKGIEIRTGNTEWGAEPGKLYFVIKHGKIVNK